MDNPEISKSRTHLLQLLTEDRIANTNKKRGDAGRKKVTENRISSSVMCPLDESRFRNKNIDIKSPSLCLQTASTISNLLKIKSFKMPGDIFSRHFS